MGRYYFGDIKGKFWVAVQFSDDAVNFGGVSSSDIILYYPCDCEYVHGKKYCNDCFQCFEDAFEEAKSLGYIDENTNKEIEDILLYESDHINIKFQGCQLQEVQRHIDELHKQIGHYIKKFTMNKDDDYEYDIELVNDDNSGNNNSDNITPLRITNAQSVSPRSLTTAHKVDVLNVQMCKQDEKILIARWCLAKQVEQCIIDKGECEFECEV